MRLCVLLHVTKCVTVTLFVTGHIVDRPLCKVCGAKHWPSEPHKFDRATATSEINRRIEAVKPAAQASVAGVARSQTPLAPVQAVPEGASKPGEDARHAVIDAP